MTAAKRKSPKPPVPIWSRPTVWLSAAIVFVCLVWGIVGCIEQAAGADVKVTTRAATVRVAADDGATARGPVWSFGSGVVVRRAGKTHVVTAAHVVRRARHVWVGVDGRWVPARRVKLDVLWDLGALRSSEAERLAALELAPGVRMGSRVTSAGFGQGNFETRPGIVQQWSAPANGQAWEAMIVSGPARQGDSGGPMVDDNGNLAGILQATDGRTTYGTMACRVGRFLDGPDNAGVKPRVAAPVELCSLPAYRGYSETAIGPRGKALQQIAKNTAQRPEPPVPAPALPVAPPMAAPPACQPTDLSPIITAIEQQGEATRAAIAEAVAAKQQTEAAEEKPAGLKGKIQAKLEADAEEGGLKGKIAEKLLRWEERGQMGVWAAIVGGIVLLVYWHKNKHGPVAGVLERVGRPELAERETEIVEKLEARVKGAVAAAATANPAVGLAVSEAEKVEKRIQEFIEARLKPAPGQQPPTPPAE